MNLITHLVSGAGNTFHISFDPVENFSLTAWTESKKKQIARAICEKTPADGFIFLKRENEKYSWFFYNKDGSDAEMCGNATRCVGYYVKNILNSPSDSVVLQTVAGSIEIYAVTEDAYQVIMTPVKKLKSDRGFYCDTGVPHLILEKNPLITNENLAAEARLLRHHTEFAPKGTNVTFVQLEKKSDKIKAVSYERGVEGFTAACGTGAVAAAFFNVTKRGESQTQVEMPGGTLIIDMSNLQRPSMTGPALLIGSYQYEI